jgi:hypothetical protein
MESALMSAAQDLAQAVYAAWGTGTSSAQDALLTL